MMLPGGKPGRHEIRRKEFGQRRRDGFHERGFPHKREIAVTGGADAWEYGSKRSNLVIVESDSTGKLSPEGQPSIILVRAVVIMNASDPGAPKCRIL
jgi:hypothetical protein